MRKINSNNYKYLAHMMGPKGENEEFVDKIIRQAMLDNTHWRKNYFADDKRLDLFGIEDDLKHEYYTIEANAQKMLAGLRRSFPFFSPRYLAHQQSETTISSMLGIFAGAFYNSNNVTPESGTVTVDWEIDACNDILSMLGLTSAPNLSDFDSEDDYLKALEDEFGWCHLTSGGTVANIEALWVARSVRYFPLSVWSACRNNDISLSIKFPKNMGTKPFPVSNEIKDIPKEDIYSLVCLRPNESIYMLEKFVLAVKEKMGLSISDAGAKAMKLLNNSDYPPSGGLQQYAEFKPVVFVSGAAHYSIAKAADILGMGRDSIVKINTDKNFQINIDDLRAKLEEAVSNKRCVISVVGIAGTTEEGAVDPIHKIIDLKEELEKSINLSFWIHVDAAWGGFIRSLFVNDIKDQDVIDTETFRKRIFGILKSQGDNWTDTSIEALKRKIILLYKSARKSPPTNLAIEELEKTIDNCIATDDFRRVIDAFKKVNTNYATENFTVNSDDRIAVVREFTEFEIALEGFKSTKQFKVSWPNDEIGEAFLAFEKADSITIDPHKMGYVPYPSGAIAFRNDRIRSFVRQEAPYITVGERSSVHFPIRKGIVSDKSSDDITMRTEAFAPFTLEGSRPSSAACSIYLASNCLPFDRKNHGSLIRASVISARILYEYLKNYNLIFENPNHEIVLLIDNPPDTNLLNFGVMPKDNTSIEIYNKITLSVYEKFSINTELGERQHSYMQPFFLSKTKLTEGHYPETVLSSFFKKSGISKMGYRKQGLAVLRSTVMNPYLMPVYDLLGDDLLMDFMKNLHRVSTRAVERYYKNL